jgi:hypothetical protein
MHELIGHGAVLALKPGKVNEVGLQSIGILRPVTDLPQLQAPAGCSNQHVNSNG